MLRLHLCHKDPETRPQVPTPQTFPGSKAQSRKQKTNAALKVKRKKERELLRFYRTDSILPAQQGLQEPPSPATTTAWWGQPPSNQPTWAGPPFTPEPPGESEGPKPDMLRPVSVSKSRPAPANLRCQPAQRSQWPTEEQSQGWWLGEVGGTFRSVGRRIQEDSCRRSADRQCPGSRWRRTCDGRTTC